MVSREGQKIPEVVFHTREGGVWKDVKSSEIFAGRTVVVLSLPGAFTPTCSSTHLPRYEQLAAVFAKEGVDEIVCISVNDAFVMEAWGKAQGLTRVRLLPDGNGEFSEAIGMLVDKSAIGFGKRSWRYSMLARNGVIEKMFVEPEQDGDPFEVSDADTMLRYLNAKAKVPDAITMFSRPGCSHCARAKDMLTKKGWSYEEIKLGTDITNASLQAVSGRATTPQVFIAGKHIGGADDLAKYLETH